jgi:hypothetical protein
MWLSVGITNMLHNECLDHTAKTNPEGGDPPAQPSSCPCQHLCHQIRASTRLTQPATKESHSSLVASAADATAASSWLRTASKCSRCMFSQASHPSPNHLAILGMSLLLVLGGGRLADSAKPRVTAYRCPGLNSLLAVLRVGPAGLLRFVKGLPLSLLVSTLASGRRGLLDCRCESTRGKAANSRHPGRRDSHGCWTWA